jgi:hypothetical protein
MIFATRQEDDQVELYASEADKPPPASFVACTLAEFRAAWRLRDELSLARLRARLERPR